MILWNFIADETFTVFGSLTVSSGVIEGLARDLYQISPNGGNFLVNGLANYTMQARKIQINSNAKF